MLWGFGGFRGFGAWGSRVWGLGVLGLRVCGLGVLGFWGLGVKEFRGSGVQF